MIYRFGPFVLDVAAFALSKGGVPVPLSPKALDLLVYLVGRQSVLVTKEELFKVLWPDTFVSDNALTQTMSELRRGLGDEASSPTYIQTVSRRGYRFEAPVDQVAADAPTTAAGGHHALETSSLDASRAFQEGRLRLESLDAAEVLAAVDNFKRAIELDPRYAPAYVGLANAHVWQFEAVRYRPDADTGLVKRALEEAQCAVQLDPQFAEAHATLSYILAGAGQLEAARSAALRAVALQPDHWPHHFRLGHATWGEERLVALRRCLALYPEFPFAYFQMAMVHVARGNLSLAEQALREGIAVQARHSGERQRFPANGLHWLLGLVHLAHGDTDAALDEFRREVERGSYQLYATEFALAARCAHGFVLLRGPKTDEAERIFRLAMDAEPTHPRARLGLAMALRVRGLDAEAGHERQEASRHIAALEKAGRAGEAALLKTGHLIAEGKTEEALAALQEIVSEGPPGPSGWTIPIEPLFDPVRALPPYQRLLSALAARAQ